MCHLPIDMPRRGWRRVGRPNRCGLCREARSQGAHRRTAAGRRLTWTGCVPSKTLIRAARLAHDARGAAAIGIGTKEVPVDFGRVMAEVRSVIARVCTSEMPEALAKAGVEVAIGDVRFLDEETVV